MARVSLATLAVLAITAAASAAAAQEIGGIGFPAGTAAPPFIGNALAQVMTPLARSPVVNPTTHRGAPPGVRVTDPTVTRASVHQQAITQIRGDAGFLAGFQHGQPLAASRQPPPPPPIDPITIIEAPFIVNNVGSTLNVTSGDGNVSQQVFGDGAPVTTASGASQASSATPARPSTAGVAPDPATANLGPLAFLPFALAHGGVTINNVASRTNLTQGTGNTAVQHVVSTGR